MGAALAHCRRTSGLCVHDRDHEGNSDGPGKETARVHDQGVGVGADLGLSICHQIVNDHRGQINVESEEGKGSTFTTILSYNFKGIGLGH